MGIAETAPALIAVSRVFRDRYSKGEKREKFDPIPAGNHVSNQTLLSHQSGRASASLSNRQAVAQPVEAPG